MVVLTIPCARLVPTEFDKERFIRIGSSKEALRKYPHIEAVLWEKLKEVQDSIVNRESPNQNLSFSKLLIYYSAKGLPLKEGTFKEELSFYVPGTRKFNILAFLMADENNITMRVSVFPELENRIIFILSENSETSACYIPSIKFLITVMS